MLTTRSLPGVLYAEDFDAPEEPDATAPRVARPPPSPEPVVLEPTFSLVELQGAAERGREEGRFLERKETTLALEAQRTEALCRLADVLQGERAGAALVAEQTASSLARAVLAAVGAVLPRLAALQALPEAAALLSALLPAMEDEPVLRVMVHPALVGPLRNDLATLPVAGSVAMEWIAVDTMEPGDIRVKWRDGSLRRDTRALCGQVTAMLEASLPASRDTGGEC